MLEESNWKGESLLSGNRKRNLSSFQAAQLVTQKEQLVRFRKRGRGGGETAYDNMDYLNICIFKTRILSLATGRSRTAQSTSGSSPNGRYGPAAQHLGAVG